MQIDEITRLKKLAGIHMDREGKRVDGDDESNISQTGTEKGQYMRKHNIQPGSAEWFRLWFAKPKLTGENPTPRSGK